MIKPGLFGKTVPADERRLDFDFANEQLLYMKKNPNILFIGDSITQFWDLQVYFETQKLLVNRGIGGDTSEYLLMRFDADVIQLNPVLVLIMIGTNDILATHSDLWWRTPGLDEHIVFEETTKNIMEMVEKCSRNSIGVALCSILPSNIAPPFNKKVRWRLTAKINSFLASLCKKQDIPYINYHENLCEEDGKTIVPEYSMDGIHVNARGYAVMASVLKDSIDI